MFMKVNHLEQIVKQRNWFDRTITIHQKILTKNLGIQQKPINYEDEMRIEQENVTDKMDYLELIIESPPFPVLIIANKIHGYPAQGCFSTRLDDVEAGSVSGVFLQVLIYLDLVGKLDNLPVCRL